jgi:hypothetical protein
MSSENFELILVRSPDDAPPFGAEYQEELRKFANEAQASSQRAFAMDSVLGGGGPIGEFAYHAAAALALINALKTICVSWLKARTGRKLRLKYGKVSIEATSIEEIEAMVKLVDQHSNIDKSARK